MICYNLKNEIKKQWNKILSVDVLQLKVCSCFRKQIIGMISFPKPKAMPIPKNGTSMTTLTTASLMGLAMEHGHTKATYIPNSMRSKFTYQSQINVLLKPIFGFNRVGLSPLGQTMGWIQSGRVDLKTGPNSGSSQTYT